MRKDVKNMAERRMFSKLVINSDEFLALPHSTQNLYFHISLNADDDGFINSHRMILRSTATSESDLKALIDANFLIEFEGGVLAVTHWLINNAIRKDRYRPTLYQKEFAQISLDESKRYTIGIPMVAKWYTQDSIGKDSIDKVSIDKDSIVNDEGGFVAPSVEEIKKYCKENNYSTDAEKFFDYYSANGWQVGKNSMKDWRATLRNWERNENKEEVKKVKPTAFSNFTQPKSDFDEIKRRKRLDLIKKLQSNDNKQEENF